MTTRRMLRPTVAVMILTLAGPLVSGCGASDDSTGGESGSQSASQPGETTPEDETTPDGEGYPTCDEVKAALGPAVEGLVELEASENGESTGVDGPELGCAWHTQETNSSSLDLEEYGGISLGISRDPSYTEESMEPLGWIVQDPRVSAAGAWALKVGGAYDPAEQLDVTGVQVVRDGVVVVLTSGGVALQDVPQLASLTNEWALGAGVAVLDLMDD